MPTLYNVDSPLDREQRANLNSTFQDIQRRFSAISTQISFLTGGQEVEDLIQRIEDTINRANSDVDAAIANVSQQLTLLTQKIQEADDKIVETENTRQQALQVISELQDLITSQMHRGEYSLFIQYYTNNEVSFDGSTYRAKRDNIGVSPPNILGESNDDWQLVARRGTDSASDTVGIWRGANQPTDTSLLWFRDPDLAIGQIIQIQRGIAQPIDSNDLWLRERGV